MQKKRIHLLVGVFVILWVIATPIFVAIILNSFYSGIAYLLALGTSYIGLTAISMKMNRWIYGRFPIPESVLKKDEDEEVARGRRRDKFWLKYNTILLDDKPFDGTRTYRASRTYPWVGVLVVAVLFSPVWVPGWSKYPTSSKELVIVLAMSLLLLSLFIYPAIFNVIKINSRELRYRDLLINRRIPLSNILELGLEVGLAYRNESFYIVFRTSSDKQKYLRIPRMYFDAPVYAQLATDISVLKSSVRLNSQLASFVSREKEAKLADKPLSRVPYEAPVPFNKRAKEIFAYFFYAGIVPMVGMLLWFFLTQYLKNRG
jgi:hypothetical protein